MNDASLPMLEHFDSFRKHYYARLQTEVPGFALAAVPIRNFLKKIVAQGGFYIRARSEYIPAIVASGRFKGCLETDHSTLNGGSRIRKESCQALFGCDPARLKPDDFPKYGYLSCADTLTNLLVTDEMAYQYGGAVIRLKKDRFMHRTTMTVGDSVNFGRSFGMVPDRVDDILPVGVFGLKNSMERRMLFQPRNPAMCWHYLASKIADGTLNTDNFFRLDEIMGGEIPMFEFFELQFHGPISIAEDVERIDVFDYREQVESPELQEAGKKLEALGIPFTASADFGAAYEAFQVRK